MMRIVSFQRDIFLQLGPSDDVLSRIFDGIELVQAPGLLSTDV